MNRMWKVAGVAAVIGALGLLTIAEVVAQDRPGTLRTIFMTAYEVKGTTTTDKLAPPAENPAEISKGYGYKAPGQADKSAPAKWEVSSYMFNPASVTVREGDTIDLTVFVVNGDEHEAWVTAPDGRVVVPKRMWRRGHEYRAHFRADRPGAYQLMCSSHAPSMLATFLVLPR